MNESIADHEQFIKDITEYEETNDQMQQVSSSVISSLLSSRAGTPPPLEIPPADGTPKGDFVHSLYAFMMKIGQPITKVPHLGYQELDLYKLYQLVTERGGMDAVTKRQEWKVVYQELGIPTMSTSASYNTRTNYKKYLYLYELEHCNFDDPDRPKDAQPIFATDEYVRIVSENYDGRVFYAKIVKSRWTDGEFRYYVHYNGWSNSHDEWMPERVLSALLPAEKLRPDRLTNPQPNRSSKSNHIIGEPAPPASGTSTPREKKKKKNVNKQRKRSLDSEFSESDSSSTVSLPIESVQDERQQLTPSKRSLRLRREFKRTNEADGGSLGEKGSNKLRLRLRHRTDQIPSYGIPPFFPSFKFVQAELEKLDSEMFLHYVPPVNPSFITVNNLHGQSLGSTPGKLNRKLVESVDLRVPILEEILGPPPLTPALPKKVGSVTTEQSQPCSSSTNDNIKGIIKELKSIKREYQTKKKLLKLYYGSSSSESGGNSTESSPDLAPTHRTTRKTRRK